MGLRFIVCLFIALFALSGCGSDVGGGLMDEAVPPSAQDILANPDKVTLFTIVSYLDSGKLGKEEYAALPVFSDSAKASSKGGQYRVLASSVVDEADGASLISSMVQAVKQGEEAGVACFFPHHAIRVEKAGRTLEILICFMCHNYMVLPEGGYNNVHMSRATGMEDTWRAIVLKHGLRDISDREVK
jgi:hypothetical protein